MEQLSTHYGVSIADTIAFGDNFNDLDMLEVVGQGYVMANGPEAVREAIGRITADNNSDGIALVVEGLLEV